MNASRTGIRIGIGLQTTAVVVIYALVNYLGFLHYARLDFSRSQKFALAGQTRSVLKEFKKPLEIIIVSSPTFLSPANQILGDLRSLMNEVLFNKREGLRVEYLDPTRNLSRIQDLQAKYGLTGLDNIIILDYDGRHRLLNIAEMGDFDFSPVARGDQPLLLAFRGEQILTSALLALLKPDAETVYFLEGHGEPSPLLELSNFCEAIGRQNAIVKTLSLSSNDTIPPDASALVLVAAKSDLEDREAAVIGAWLRKGGKMFVLLAPNIPAPNLHSLLANSGITPRDDRVLRLIELPMATGILRDVTAHVLPNAEVTRRLEGMNILFPGSTQSLAFDQEFAKSEKIRIRPLVEAAEEFWGETNYLPNQPGGVAYQDGVDNGQPIIIGASADRDAVENDLVGVQSSRLIVIGSSQFALNASLSRPGLDLLVGCVNALIDRGSVSGITPKNASRFLIQLTDIQISRLATFIVLGIPSLAGILGFLVWLRRRA